MPPKVWNEDLVQAMRARKLQAWKSGNKNQFQWHKAAEVIERVRKDIRLTSTGKIFNLPTPGGDQSYTKTVYEECQRIIKGEASIFPPGWIPLSPEQWTEMEEKMNNVTMENTPYLNQMKKKSGAYAIMMAFHLSSSDMMPKDEIIRLAQPHCTEAMESDFHSGRMYGAWKGKDTLVKHGYITEHKAGAFTNNGWRSKGKNSYSISPAGKGFIEGMKKKWPDAFLPTRSNQFNNPFGMEESNQDLKHSPNESFGLMMASSALSAGLAHSTLLTAVPILSATKPQGSNKNNNMQDDAQQLRQFVSTASVGETKEFKVGKERRRKLHNLCDKLQTEYAGLVLSHDSSYSTGSSNRRTLAITIRSKPSSSLSTSSSTGAVATIPSSLIPSPTFFEDPIIHQTSKMKPREESPVKQSSIPSPMDNFGSPGHRLGGDSSLSHSSNNQSQHRNAAAKAAMQRFDQSSNNTKKRKQSPKLEKKDSTILSRATKPNPTESIICLDNSSDEEDVCNRKVPPRKRQRPLPTSDVIDLSNNDETHTTNKRTAASANASVAMVCLDDDGDDGDETTTNISTSLPKYQEHHNVCNNNEKESVMILIDNRERLRNASPRVMRTELTKMLQSGELKAVWPQDISSAEVVEAKLEIGDFSFKTMTSCQLPIQSQQPPNLNHRLLSLVVERKRVGDLISRSKGGDHWKQLQRMRDTNNFAILLIENDPKTATRHEAYGAPLEPRPSDHVLENAQDIFRFMGRAILLSRAIKFVQTKDDRGTYRSIGALALISKYSSKIKEDETPFSPPTAALQQQTFVDKLTSGGIHWKISKSVASEVGSISAMRQLYDSCSTENCKLGLLQPIVQAMSGENNEDNNLRGSPEDWSEAMYYAFHAREDVRIQTKNSFEELKTLTDDHAFLLISLYSEADRNEAINKVFEKSSSSSSPSRRLVRIELPKKFKSLLPEPHESSFYNLVTTSETSSSEASLVRFSTIDNMKSSNYLSVFILEGKVLVELILNLMNDKDFSTSIQIAQHASITVHSMCQTAQMNENKFEGRHVILIRGLPAAFNLAATKIGFREESWVLVEMATGFLMTEFDYVVIQAIRRKGEVEMILQQFALACFHYQLLTNEGSDSKIQAS